MFKVRRDKKLKVYLNVEIDEELREQFKIKCLQDKTNMKKQITKMIRDYLKSNEQERITNVKNTKKF